jgi:DNA recombination protein RmuC
MEALQPYHVVIVAIASVVLLVTLLTVRFRSVQNVAALKNEALSESNRQFETELALTQQRHQQSQQLSQELKQSLETERAQIREFQRLLTESEKKSLELKGDLQKEKELSDQKLEQAEQNKKQLKIEFENLAGKILDEKAKTFNQNSQATIETLLKPFRDQIDGFQKRVNEVHSDSIKGNSAIEAEIKKVLEAGLKMGDDAKNLTSALKGDSQKRGGWGEALWK